MKMPLHLHDFEGELLYSHCLEDGQCLSGRRVGVIGADTDAVRLLPHIVKAAARVKVFQQEPAWVLPHAAMRLSRSPSGILEAWARAHLRRQVKEPWLRRQLAPQGRIHRQRLVFSNDYYAALQHPHCKLLTWPIDRIASGGIRTVEGVEHQLDCIVLARPDR